MEMHNPIHPGQILKDIYLDPYSISIAELACRLGVEEDRLAKIVGSEAQIDAELAIRLEAVIGGSARSWMGMQSSYDIWNARQRLSLGGLEKMSFPELDEIPYPDKYYA